MSDNQAGRPASGDLLARGGGNATAAGVGFQARLGASFAAQMLSERQLDAHLGLAGARIRSIRFETEAPVDDILIETDQGGYIFVQAKTALTFSSQTKSELGKVADQIVRLWLSCVRGTGGRGWDRPLRRNVDVVLLVAGRDSSATILTDLTRALAAIQATSMAPLPEGPQNALDRFTALLAQTWNDIDGRVPTADEVGDLLKHVTIHPFDPEGPDRVSAQETLAHVLENADDAVNAFAVLAQKCEDLMRDRLGADASGFRQALAVANIPTLAPPSFVPDVNQLRSYSDGIARQLNHYEDTKVGADEIRIDRPCVPAVTRAALDDSLLLIGEPGAGKSAVISSAARELRRQGYQVLELAVDRLPVESMEGLSQELGLAHSVVNVLRNWPGDGPAFLLIDALDATRGGRSEAVFRALIAEVLALPEQRWRVVASIRTFDLRLGQEFRELFAGAVPDRTFADPSFLDVRHVHIPPWSESELNDFLARAPGIATAIAAGGRRLRELAQVPFNTKLLADLISNGVEPRAFGEINSQVELLALYWTRRIIGLGSSAEVSLETVVSNMVQARALRARKLDVARTNAEALDGLLGANVLVLLGQDQQFVAFRHHILFDYAASRLYLRLDNLDVTRGLLERDRGLGLMLAPALAFALRGLWVDSDAGRRRFWDAVTCFAGDTQCDPIARSVAARTASELPQSPEDVRDLVAALGADNSERPRVVSAFGHFVGALAVRVDDKEPITIAPWCELAEGAAAYVADVLWPLRTLVFLLVERAESDKQRQQVGRAARAVLTFGLNHPATPSQLIAAAIDFVAATYASDVTASRDLLQRLFRPDHFAARADQELPWLARKIAPISKVDPDFVVEIYAAIFTGQIDDTSKTSIGDSQILPLISNRRQDYDSARFSLKEYFPRFLAAWPIQALTALQRAIAGYIASEHPIEGEPKSWTLEAGGRQVRLREDLSHIWAWNPDEEHADNTIALLKAFVARLRSTEPIVAQAMVNHVINHNDLAVIWARTFLVAAERPDVLGGLLWPLATEPPFLQCADTIKDAVDFIAARYPFEPESDRERFERLALAFDFTWSRAPDNARRHFFQRVFGRIGAAQLVTTEARSLIEADPSPAETSARNRRPFMITSEFASEPNPYWWLGQAGVDVREPNNAALLNETAEIKEALGLEPPAKDAIDIPAAISRLVRFHQDIGSSQAAAAVTEHAYDTLGRGVAKVTGLPVEQLRANSDAIRVLVPVIEHLSILPSPSPRADAEEKFERQASWSPSSRIECAEAIMHLMHLDTSYVAPFRSTIENLLADPEPAVRMQIADRLTSLWLSDQGWMWALAERIARQEKNRGVLKYFVNYFLARVVHHAPDRVEELAFVIAQRGFPRDEEPTRELLDQLGSIMALLWISHGRARAQSTLTAWLSDAPAFEPELAHAISVSREALVLKYSGTDEREAEITHRAQEFAAWVVEVTATGLESYLAQTQPSELEQKRVGGFAKLLNNVSDQYYFASGAFQDHQGGVPALASNEAKAAFLQDNYTTLRRIADAGTPATIFHLIELFEFLIPADPPRVFDLVAHALLGAGKRHGFQFESLGADRFVGMIGRFLADYRSLFTNDDRREKLVACLDAFMEAGWPAARRLLYRLPELLQ